MNYSQARLTYYAKPVMVAPAITKPVTRHLHRRTTMMNTNSPNRHNLTPSTLGYVVAILSIFVSTLCIAPTVSAASGFGYDGVNPEGSGCGSTSSPKSDSISLNNSNSNSVGTLELRYSSECGTSWSRVTIWSNNPKCVSGDNACGDARVTRTQVNGNPVSGQYQGCSWSTNCHRTGKNQWWSYMVYNNCNCRAYATGDYTNGNSYYHGRTGAW